jgi:hypothetical protein
MLGVVCAGLEVAVGVVVGELLLDPANNHQARAANATRTMTNAIGVTSDLPLPNLRTSSVERFTYRLQ